MFEKIPKRPQDKRKRIRQNDPEDIEGFLGPWGGFVNEVKVSKPDEVSGFLNLTITVHLSVLIMQLKNCRKFSDSI